MRDKNNNFRNNDKFKKKDSFKSYQKEPRIDYTEEAEDTGVVVGRNAVRELLKSERVVDKLYVRKGDREGSITVLIAEAANKSIPIVEVESQKLDYLANGANHQGIVAMAAIKEYSTIDDMIELANERGEKPLIVVCDSIEDPHNLGAIIRCAECAGAHGIVIPKRRSVGITPTVYKSSAGAIEHMMIAKVSNIATTIEQLKEKGLWIFSAEAGGDPYYETDFKCACAIVLGSEGNGVSKIVKDNSDYIVSIPMYGKVNSLNVSTAASVILCHVARMQRS
jgi:23S rRNA (guanosine2251-2'-O)-methyltransferase